MIVKDYTMHHKGMSACCGPLPKSDIHDSSYPSACPSMVSHYQHRVSRLSHSIECIAIRYIHIQHTITVLFSSPGGVCLAARAQEVNLKEKSWMIARRSGWILMFKQLLMHHQDSHHHQQVSCRLWIIVSNHNAKTLQTRKPEVLMHVVKSHHQRGT